MAPSTLSITASQASAITTNSVILKASVNTGGTAVYRLLRVGNDLLSRSRTDLQTLSAGTGVTLCPNACQPANRAQRIIFVAVVATSDHLKRCTGRHQEFHDKFKHSIDIERYHGRPPAAVSSSFGRVARSDQSRWHAGPTAWVSSGGDFFHSTDQSNNSAKLLAEMIPRAFHFHCRISSRTRRITSGPPDRILRRSAWRRQNIHYNASAFDSTGKDQRCGNRTDQIRLCDHHAGRDFRCADGDVYLWKRSVRAQSSPQAGIIPTMMGTDASMFIESHPQYQPEYRCRYCESGGTAKQSR